MEIRKSLFNLVKVIGDKVEIVFLYINLVALTGRLLLFFNNKWSFVMTSLTVSKISMVWGKTLYSNCLRNLLASISAFTVIAVMFFANFEGI